MTNSINNYQLKHCEKEEDSKTRVQEELMIIKGSQGELTAKKGERNELFITSYIRIIFKSPLNIILDYRLTKYCEETMNIK